MKLPIKNPKPDIEMFRKIILGEAKPDRVHFVELYMDEDIMAAIAKDILGIEWVSQFAKDRDARKKYWDNVIEIYYRLGYDFVRVTGGYTMFPLKMQLSDDSSKLSGTGKRAWCDENNGLISSWEDFDKYPWPDVDKVDLWDFECVSGHLPEGMGIFTGTPGGPLEMPNDFMIGYQALSLMIYDEPELVEAVLEKVGNALIGFYKRLMGLPKLAGIFQGDDMGYTTSTLFSPDFLRSKILPWHKKLASLAHDNDYLYMLHSCGKLTSIMDDLIDDVKIDAKHSYEESAIPVSEFKKMYGNRVGILGGIDIDRLARLPEEQLRSYVRNTLDICMQDGRYALGSGNSICNYIPLNNYFAMLDEGLNWC